MSALKDALLAYDTLLEAYGSLETYAIRRELANTEKVRIAKLRSETAAEKLATLLEAGHLMYELGNSKEALNSSIRIMKESGAHAVKMEGGLEVVDSVNRILSAGVPVMGHLGLTPQSIYKFGTYVVRARENEEAAQLEEDSKCLEEAGCFSIVLEKIPAKLAENVSKNISIPIIGIGAGNKVDGQVLVSHDMLGINKGFNPRFLRRYTDMYSTIHQATSDYINDVKSGNFPNDKEQY